MNKETIEDICGEYKELMFDKNIKKLNFELVYKNEIPMIVISDWTDDKNVRDLMTLHIKEAVEIKSIIDNLIIDYLEFKTEKVVE